MHCRIGAARNNVFLRKRFNAVGDRLEKSERPNAIGAQAILNAGQSLALKYRGKREKPGKNAHDGNHAQQHICNRPQRAWQKTCKPVAQKNEDLVQSRGHGLVSSPGRR